LKQGISLDTLLLACAAPVTVGQSINYLVQVAYQDTDANAVVLPYYNASNPSQAYSGPNNAGTTNFTTRKGACVISAKAGVSAATGSQTTPAPDAGYTGAFVVTVAYGQTTITAPNIAAYAGAPFIPSAGLIAGGLQGNVCNISAAGGTADAISGAYTPGIAALTNGMTLYVRAASANATTTPTFTPNSGTIAAKTIVKGNGLALVAGDIAGVGHWIELQYDLTLDKWILLNPARGVTSVNRAFTSITTSGNFTTPANITTSTVFKITLVGGGAGGGGSNGANATGGGGGAGGAASFYIGGLSPSTAYAVVIGGGGAGGSSAGTDGGTGGTTQITIGGTVYSVTGGVAGVGTTTTTVNINAAQGTPSASILALPNERIFQTSEGVGFSNSPQFAGCTGAGLPWGTAGIGGRTGAAPVAASGFGVGGGGAVGATMAGGAGMPGLFMAEWIA
jgi:hypothetical protein